MQILIDTSMWIEALRPSGREETRQRVQAVLTEDSAVLCEPILLELWNGARGEPEREYLRDLEKNLEVLPITAAVWSRARELAFRCRSRGITAPPMDLLIMACALEHQVFLLHRDQHFEQIEQAAGDS